MNHTYKTIYDAVKGIYVAVSELTNSRRKTGSIKLITVSLAALFSSLSFATPVTLTGDYIRTAVSDYGTLGSNGANPPGIQYDKTGTQNFGVDDYLTPGSPHQTFSVKTAETGLQYNNNNNQLLIPSTSGPTDISSGTVAAATWSGQYSDYYTVKNTYSVGKTEEAIRVETVLTALQDLTEVRFATALDPDPDVNTYNSYYTTNGRGTTKFAAEDWVHSLGQQTGLPVGIYSTSSYTHNTGVSSAWSLDPDFYLAGNMDGDGDYVIGMGFNIGTLLSGQSVELVYYYLMGEQLDTVVIPPSADPSVPAVTKTNIDLRKVSYDSSQLGITVNPAFEGGTLKIDTAGTYTSDFSLNNLGGTIDANANDAVFSGEFFDLSDSSSNGTLIVSDSVGGGSTTFEGVNSYTGKTVIEATTLALSGNGNIASSSGVELANTTAVFDVANITAQATTVQDLTGVSGSVVKTGNTVLTAGTANDTEFAGSFEGNGGYVKVGSGNMLLSGDSSSFTGKNAVQAGELQVNGVLGGSTLTVASGSILSGNGTIGGVVTAASGSTINPGADTQDTLTLSDDLNVQAASVIAIQTTLETDDSATDKLVVQGNTSGQATVQVTNQSGAGALTQEGIKVIDVEGQSDAVFTLPTAAIAVNSYQYRLVQNGLSTPTDGDWYLRSTYRPGVGNYLAAASSNVIGGFNLMSTMHQRNGTLKAGENDGKETWVRTLGFYNKLKGKTQFEYEQFSTGVQIGQDLWRSEGANRSRAGITAQYLHSKVDVYDHERDKVGISSFTGKVKTQTAGIGFYHTYVGNRGGYIDTVAQVNRLYSKLKDTDGIHSKLKGWQVGASIEVGKGIPLGTTNWALEPQAQIAYLYTHYSDLNDAFSRVSVDSRESLTMRAGLRLNKQFTADERDGNLYFIVNYHHQHSGKQDATFFHADGNRLDVSEKFERHGIEGGVGLQTKVGKNSYIFGDVRHLQLLNNKGNQTRLDVGFKMSF
ncbi:autotransporter outer membrane beta-barrel domain-containing protein [Glaesserella sp.]|uniref:autotransporter outer membrane beta-barrel domain-containing protein n=1 Tax=Glaesserella sp. TaxID=2094731 RepID=UPI00359F7B4E